MKIPPLQLLYSPEKLKQYSQDPDFHVLLSLGRVINALGFCYECFLDAKEKTGPRMLRHQMQVFFLSASYLFEVIKFAKSHLKRFKDMDEYKATLGTFKDDAEKMIEQSHYLYKVRNKVTFHFSANPEAVDGGLEFGDFENTHGRLWLSSDPRLQDVYYQLPDDSVLDFLLGESLTLQEKEQRYAVIIQEMNDLLSKFYDGSVKLATALATRNFPGDLANL